MSTIGERIKASRENKGLLQSELAKMIGEKSAGVISNWEQDVSKPNANKIIKLCEVLDVSPAYLLDYRGKEKSSPYSSEASKLADAYDNKLDPWGRQAVRDLVETEMARVADESRFQGDPLKEGPKVINLFVEPSAAGIAVPTMGRDYEFYELKPEDPPGAAYAVRLQGNSMEPDFPDGSIVFVNHDALRDGDIGIFSVDGGTVCKQYHQEGGVVYLFSLNRRRSDADLVLFPGGNRSFVCQGRVITRKRFPVPGRG